MKREPRRKCRRCNLRLDAHFDDKCADGRAYVAVSDRMAASQSFNAEEVEVLRQLVRAATMGTSSQYLCRTAGFVTLAKKVPVMARRIDLVKLKKEQAA